MSTPVVPPSMPYETAGQQIYSHGITVNYRILEDATKLVDPLAVINAGMPVTLSTVTGSVIAGGANVATYGLAKSNKNTYVDETLGSFGAYGSGKMTVVIKGAVTVRPNYFIAPDGTIAVVPVYDTGSFTVMAPLYVSPAGLITSTNTQGNTLLGYCTKPPSSNDATMEIIVDCM